LSTFLESFVKKFRIFCALIICSFLLNCGCISSAKAADLSDFFGDYAGTAVFFDENSGEYGIYNEALAADRVSPCSTFKIFLTLAGLEYGILQDSSTEIKWDGVIRSVEINGETITPDWNRDLTLREAFTNSAVWYFYDVYEKIGDENIAKFMRICDYGNQDATSDGRFWVNGSLEISPLEQVNFLRKVFNGELPFSKNCIEILREVMYVGDLNGGKLHGKTGTNGENTVGWFVGFYEKNGDRIYFAVRLVAGEDVSGTKAKEILQHILCDLY
jgi:bla regulator protein BlaR1